MVLCPGQRDPSCVFFSSTLRFESLFLSAVAPSLPTHPSTYPLPSGVSPCFLLVVSPNLSTLFLPQW